MILGQPVRWSGREEPSGVGVPVTKGASVRQTKRSAKVNSDKRKGRRQDFSVKRPSGAGPKRYPDSLLGVHRDSVQTWIDRFKAHGPDGLLDEDRPGGPRLLDESETRLLDELFEQFPKRPARVLEELKNNTGKTISRDTLREYARRLGRSCKRSRRSLKAKRIARAFAKCRAELQQLMGQPDLDVVFFDEAGFSLKGVVGMGWFRRGERAEVPVTGSHGSSVQTLGFEQPDGTVVSYLHKGYVNSQTVIAVFDDYVKRIDGETVVVLDNASCHTSGAFTALPD